MFVKPRVLMDKPEGNEFRETPGAFLYRVQQQKMTHPIGRFFDVSIHHRRSRGNAELMCGGDDFDPAGNGQFVGAELRRMRSSRISAAVPGMLPSPSSFIILR